MTHEEMITLTHRQTEGLKALKENGFETIQLLVSVDQYEEYLNYVLEVLEKQVPKKYKN